VCSGETSSAKLTIELGVRWRLLAAPDCVGWHEGLRLGRDGREDALLREALAVGAATVLRLVESGASYLATRQCKLKCDATRSVASDVNVRTEHTFLLLQYLHAIAVLWRGAGWAGAA
jgi:hypothetical protein